MAANTKTGQMPKGRAAPVNKGAAHCFQDSHNAALPLQTFFEKICAIAPNLPEWDGIVDDNEITDGAPNRAEEQTNGKRTLYQVDHQSIRRRNASHAMGTRQTAR